VKIGKQYTDALVDTGAMKSLISENLANSLKLKIDRRVNTSHHSLITADGTEIRVIGKTTTELYFKGLKVPFTIQVARHLEPNFLLGVDFMSMNSAVVDYPSKPPALTLFDGLIRLPLYSRCDE